MKPYIPIVVALLFSCFQGQGQAYRNIINNGTAFYAGSSAQPSYLSGVKAESSTPQGTDTVFLSVNTFHSATPFDSLLNTSGGILGRKIDKLSNGWFRFYNVDGDTINLNTGARLNDTWKFMNLPDNGRLMITCTTIAPESILSVTDTIKTFTFQAKDAAGGNISHFYNGKTIRLSSQFGLVQTYEFSQMPEATELYSLQGRTSPPIGYKGLTCRDVYNYDVGDVFHISKLVNYQLTSQHYTNEFFTIKTVVSKYVSADSTTVSYNYDYCLEERYFSFSQGYVSSYSNGTMQETFPYTQVPIFISANPVPDIYNASGIRYYALQDGTIPGVPASGQKYDYYKCCWIENPDFNNRIHYVEYGKGVGKVRYSKWTLYNWQVYYDYENLVYCKKGNFGWGNPIYSSCEEMLPLTEVSPDTAMVGCNAGDTAIIHIRSNKDWLIEVPPGTTQFTFTPDHGSGNGDVIVTANDTNLTTTPVSTVIRFQFGSISAPTYKEYHVIQEATCTPFLLLTSDTLSLDYQIGSWKEVYIRSNRDWIIKNSDWPYWVSPSVTSGSNNQVVYFSALANHLGAGDRITNFMVEGPAGSLPLCVKQAGYYGTGIEPTSRGKVQIHPNPASISGIITVSGLPDGIEKRITLYDMTGRVLLSDTFSGKDYSFQQVSRPRGVYFMKITTTGGALLSVQKVVLE